jgi:hypothetical protein
MIVDVATGHRACLANKESSRYPTGLDHQTPAAQSSSGARLESAYRVMALPSRILILIVAQFSS